MELITNTARQTGELLRSQPMARKMVLLGLVLGSVAVMTTLIVRAQTGGYSVLYDGIERGEIGDIARQLDRRGIPYRIDAAGTMIKVPRRRVDDAFLMLSMEGLPNTGQVGYELLDRGTIGQSNFIQQKNYHRMMEGALARTLRSFESVEAASVHIALPDESPFLTEAREAKASVQLKLHRGRSLSEREISGITHFISYAIKGVDPDNVAIVDQQGNLLNARGDNGMAQTTTAQAQFKTAVEERLKREIESLIERTIGRGRVAARVTAEYDFSSLREERQTFNPDDQDPIATMEQSVLERSASGLEPGGPAGSTSNVPSLDAGGESGESAIAGGLRQHTTRQFAVSQERRESHLSAPRLQRLTVAVMVDGNRTEHNGVEHFEPLSDEELAGLESLVRAAIGYNEDRGDVVTIRCSPFAPGEMGDLEEMMGWINPETRLLMEQVFQWTVIGLIGLLLITMVVRPAMHQILVTPAPAQGLPGSRTALPRSAEAGTEAGGKGGEARDKDENTDDQSAKASGGTSWGGALAERLLGVGNEQRLQIELQQRAAEQARMTQEQAQRIHDEVLETTKSQPQKTVSLLRQWMDEG